MSRAAITLTFTLTYHEDAIDTRPAFSFVGTGPDDMPQTPREMLVEDLRGAMLAGAWDALNSPVWEDIAAVVSGPDWREDRELTALINRGA